MSDEHLLVKLLKNRQRKESNVLFILNVYCKLEPFLNWDEFVIVVFSGNETGDVEPENEFRSLCMEWGIGDKGDSYKTIPRFYTKVAWLVGKINGIRICII